MSERPFWHSLSPAQFNGLLRRESRRRFLAAQTVDADRWYTADATEAREDRIDLVGRQGYEHFLPLCQSWHRSAGPAPQYPRLNSSLVSGTSATDTTVVAGQYYYYATAVDARNAESAL